ncbi:RuBisCO large subunit C-terminal-like domain-containing protein [Limoniibacter endophyticus]|uniref:Ribulose bisphosphate carboxylaseoxygenase large subunit n=1 Tax=Limoniibacter endophyticus TaxID=1565040 RepID=A0A8J3DK83_9HYPH|nr:RuBisCO large subunit C-terminal-like domain-containing protein [Limoniibacter endophyticus]GHC75597.1 ribulose bisphosphate carboxylaseoxygenase large subunit [Limoniibacter endophyticus]
MNARVNDEHFEASYLIETPLDPEKVAEIMAGEQSCGTFIRVPGENDDLRARARADIVSVEEVEPVGQASMPSAWLERKAIGGPFRRAHVTIRFPVANVGANLSTLAATVAGNLFDLGEVTGLRLETVSLPRRFREQFCTPSQGVAGTRALLGVPSGPMVGSIIKPNVGLSSDEIARLVGLLCEAGIDFIKDDEIAADPVHAPLAERIPAVMAEVRKREDKLGRKVMVAFNITDETDAMRRHADLVAREGGSCVMASLNWCGFSAIETLRRSTDLVLHGHRNGYGAFSRHEALGIGFSAYQTLWRLAGVDHMHVHGLKGKFAQPDAEVIEGAQACLSKLTPDGIDDRVLPAFSSGQWAGTVPATWDAIKSEDVLFMAGGGVMGHPGGPSAGIESIREAFAAMRAGETLEKRAQTAASLREALDFFGAV